MKTVVIGLIGTKLDRRKKRERKLHNQHDYNSWRPSVDLCRHNDFPIDRIELLHQDEHRDLAQQLESDVAAASKQRTEARGHQIQLRDPWDFEETYAALHDFALSYPFKPETEQYYIHISTGTHVAQICLFLLAEARYIPGKLLQSSPPTEGQPSHYRVIDLDLSRYDQLASRFKQEWQDNITQLKSGIATRNLTFNQLIEKIEYVASHSTHPMLLHGPTGAGKSQLAKRIHKIKHQNDQVQSNFVEVNCAVLRGDQAMSTIFGHIKGAFTGAQSARDGMLKKADGGLLFLDEIGELGLDEQALLLRAIEEKRFAPMGADHEISSDFQLIAGTNLDLKQAVTEGKFREDLLARLDLWTFTLPSLRERPEDIEPNIEYELQRYIQANGQFVRFSHEAKQHYLSFACSSRALWSANFRDLTGSVTRMATLAPGGRITIDIVHDEITLLNQRWAPYNKALTNGTEAALTHYLSAEQLAQLDRFDQAQLQDVITVCQQSSSLSAAGRALFNHSRQQKKSHNDSDRLRKYLAKFDLTWQQIQSNSKNL